MIKKKFYFCNLKIIFIIKDKFQRRSKMNNKISQLKKILFYKIQIIKLKKCSLINNNKLMKLRKVNKFNYNKNCKIKLMIINKLKISFKRNNKK